MGDILYARRGDRLRSKRRADKARRGEREPVGLRLRTPGAEPAGGGTGCDRRSMLRTVLLRCVSGAACASAKPPPIGFDGGKGG